MVFEKLEVVFGERNQLGAGDGIQKVGGGIWRGTN